MIDLNGRRVLVTGAARGIGAATARAVTELGGHVVATDVQDLAETEAAATGLGGTVEVIPGDLRDGEHLETLLAQGPYHAMAHVAAIFQGAGELSFHERFHQVLDINVRATIELSSAMVKQMAVRGGGFIVMVGSLAGRSGGTVANDSLDYAAYTASKGGVHAVVRWLSRHATPHGVRVNGIAPGGVDTPLAATVTFDPTAFPLGRMGRPGELGWPIALMCTEAAGFMAGAVVDINGGVWVG